MSIFIVININYIKISTTTTTKLDPHINNSTQLNSRREVIRMKLLLNFKKF